MKPQESPRRNATTKAGKPDPKQWEGQLNPHQLVATPWEMNPKALGTQSMQTVELERQTIQQSHLVKATLI